MRKISFIALFVLVGFSASGQQRQYQPSFWNLLSLSGELELNGYYRSEEFKSTIVERTNNSIFSGGGLLSSRSYFWHPNFLEMDLDLGYNPSLDNLTSYASPDRKQTNAAKSINFRTRWFKRKKLNWGTSFNYVESSIKRENLNTINTDNLSWGAVMQSLNSFVPITLNYKRSISKQQVQDSEQNYRNEQSSIEGHFKKYIGKNNRNDLRIYHKEFLYQTYNTSAINNTINEANLSNTFYFKDEAVQWNSRVIYFDQETGFRKYDRFQISEGAVLRLPENLKLNANYNFLSSNQNLQKSTQQTYKTSLQHKLYLSLVSQIGYRYYRNEHSFYDLKENNYSASLNYTKKIPFNGVLKINYNYDINKKENEADPFSTQIYNEVYQLKDAEIVLLQKPEIDINTVSVKDESGTIIYQANIDYILLERGGFIEIQRIPGGLVANNATVLIDYIAVQSGSYQYDGRTTGFYSGISLFNSKFEMYYKEFKQEYPNATGVQLALDNVAQKTYGSAVNFGFVNARVEYEEYKSTLLPFRMLRVNALSQGQLLKKLSYAVNGNYRKYFMIFEEGQQQEYVDVSTNLNYRFNNKSSMNLYGGYRKQSGDGTNIELLTGKVEFNTRVNSLYINGAVEVYSNKYDQLNRNFTSAKIRIIRKF